MKTSFQKKTNSGIYGQTEDLIDGEEIISVSSENNEDLNQGDEIKLGAMDKKETLDVDLYMKAFN